MRKSRRALVAGCAGVSLAVAGILVSAQMPARAAEDPECTTTSENLSGFTTETTECRTHASPKDTDSRLEFRGSVHNSTRKAVEALCGFEERTNPEDPIGSGKENSEQLFVDDVVVFQEAAGGQGEGPGQQTVVEESTTYGSGATVTVESGATIFCDYSVETFRQKDLIRTTVKYLYPDGTVSKKTSAERWIDPQPGSFGSWIIY